MAFDARTLRLTVAAAAGACVWGAFLVLMAQGLQVRPAGSQAPEPPLELRLVEIEQAAPSAAPGSPSTPTTAGQQKAAPPKKQPVQPALARTPPQPVRRPMPAADAPAIRASEPAHAATFATGSPDQTATPAPTSPANNGGPAGEQPSAGTSAGNSPARAIAQPLPSVPDELREQAYQTIATARLVIHTDGSVAVELIRPTQYPRLNQIVIETLRSWRFFPAMQNGHPIETQQEVRVHFNVS